METILEAARLAPELEVRVIGSGQLNGAMDDRPPNVEWVEWIEYDDLPREYWGAGCALGIFGTSDKALRVIPNKAYHALACGAPLITADTPAARELLRDGENALLVPPGDPAALAEAMRRLAADPELGRALSRGGRGRLRGAGERGGARRALAVAARRAPRVRPRPKVLLWTAIAAYAVGFGALSILQYRAYNTGRFDLGNMAQAVWATAHGHPLEITNLQGDQASRLGSHVDPILAAFAPLWWIWPSAAMLVAAQAVAIALGALPVFWLARKHLGSEQAALGFALAYLLYPAVQWLTLNEFHPVALACPLLLYAFWYLDEDRLAAFAIFAVLAALTKEEIPLVIAGMGVWYAVSRRRWAGRRRDRGRSACCLTAISVRARPAALQRGRVVELLPALRLARTLARRDSRDRLHRSGQGAVEPCSTARACTTSLDLFVPLLLLALAAPVVLVAAVPELGLNLLSATHTQSSIHHHYTAGLIPPLIVATVLGAARVTRSRPDLRVPLAMTLVVRDGRRELRARRGAGLARASRRADVPGVRGARRDPRPDHGPCAPADPERRRGQRDELARLAPLRRAGGSSASRTSRTRSGWRPTRPSPATRTAGIRRRPPRRSSRLRRNPSWRLVFSEDGVLVFKRKTSSR